MGDDFTAGLVPKQSAQALPPGDFSAGLVSRPAQAQVNSVGQTYDEWKKARQEFDALPTSQKLKRMIPGFGPVPDPAWHPGENPGMGEGRNLLESGANWTDQGPIQMGRGAADVAKGNIAKGGHELISGAGTTALPAAPFAVIANPAMAARGIAGGVVGSTIGQAGAKVAGANPEQQEFTGDIGNLLGGFTAASGLPRALLQTPLKNLAANHADALLALLSPRKALINSILKMASADAPAAPAAAAAATTEQAANPSAVIHNVPSFQPKPGPQAPANLLDKATAPVAQGPKLGTFDVVPPEGAVAEAKTPNMEIYKEGDIAPKPKPRSPTQLLDDLVSWDRIVKLRDTLSQQIQDGQGDMEAWIKAHNQQSPGGKPPSEPDLEAVLRKSIADAQAKKAAAAQGQQESPAHGAGGVSAEEAARPGTNYVVTKGGQLTYHGKSFDPGSTPAGSSHVTVLPNGQFRVNAGPGLNPTQGLALKRALFDQGK